MCKPLIGYHIPKSTYSPHFQSQYIKWQQDLGWDNSKLCTSKLRHVSGTSFCDLHTAQQRKQFDPYTILSAEIYFTLNLTRTTTYVSAKNETKSVHVQQLNLHGKYLEPCVHESYQALINMPQFIFAPSFYHSNVEKFTSNAFLRQCNMKRLVTEAR